MGGNGHVVLTALTRLHGRVGDGGCMMDTSMMNTSLTDLKEAPLSGGHLPGVLPSIRIRGDIFFIAIGASILGVPFFGFLVGIPLVLVSCVKLIQHALLIVSTPPHPLPRAWSAALMALGAFCVGFAALATALPMTYLALRIQRFLYESGRPPLTTPADLKWVLAPILGVALGSTFLTLGLWMRNNLPRPRLFRLWLLFLAPVPLAVVLLLLYAVAQMPLSA